MQVVSEEVSANGTAVSIINSKEGAFRPLLTLVILRFRFHNIQNDCDPILIIITDDALIRIRAIARNQAVALIRILGVLIIWQALALARFTQIDLAPDLIEVQIATAEACAWRYTEEILSFLPSSRCACGSCFRATLALVLVFIFGGGDVFGGFGAVGRGLETATALVPLDCMLGCRALRLIVRGLTLLFNFEIALWLHQILRLTLFGCRIRFLRITASRVFLEFELFVYLFLFVQAGCTLAGRCRITRRVKHVIVLLVWQTGLTLISATTNVRYARAWLENISCLLIFGDFLMYFFLYFIFGLLFS